MAQFYWFIPLGFAIGFFGTLVGAGGGFLLMPILIWLYPNESADHLTGISLAVVFFNALCGSVAYVKKGRVDWISVRQFSAFAIPGAVLGALTTHILPRHSFDLLFGIILLLIATYLFYRSGKPRRSIELENGRVLIERDGTKHHISYSSKLGVFISFVVGYISSLLGIGGGILHVPAMVNFLNFPIHIATATSHAVLAVTSFVGLMVHMASGKMGEHLVIIFFLVPGVIVGAQMGARASSRVKGPWILRVLALAIFSVGLRLLWRRISV